MKKTIFSAVFLVCVLVLIAQNQKTVQLNEHTKIRGTSVMEAFQNRQSIRAYQAKDLSLQDLSDLLWAANGINRPKIGKKTAPSAMNAQDVDIFICRADGTFLFDAAGNSMKPITSQDIRPLVDGKSPSGAPVILLLVSDLSKFRGYTPISKNLKDLSNMSCMDAGIVSQNISIFCAGTNLGTVPRAGGMDHEGISKALKLKESQSIWMNHPVGYAK
jgi:Nitroreductase